MLQSGTFHLAVKGGVSITIQSIPWTHKFTQLEHYTLQFYLGKNTAGCLQPPFPLCGLLTTPALQR